MRPSRRTERALVLTVLGAGLVLAGWATPASAHGEGNLASDYRVTVRGIDPTPAGVKVRAVDGGTRLELENRSSGTVEVRDPAGAPMLRVGPDGAEVYESGSGATARWRRVSERPVTRWHDERVYASTNGDWSIPILLDGVALTVRGTARKVPAPEPARWWVATLATAALLVSLGRVRSAVAGWALLGVAAGAGVLAVLWSFTLPGGVLSNALPALCGLAALIAAATVAGLAVVRRPGGWFFLAVTAGCVAFGAGVAHVAVFRYPVLAVSWDPGAARLAVAAMLGGGAGVAGASMLRWYLGAPVR